jgi:hypothetical protein
VLFEGPLRATAPLPVTCCVKRWGIAVSAIATTSTPAVHIASPWQLDKRLAAAACANVVCLWCLWGVCSCVVWAALLKEASSEHAVLVKVPSVPLCRWVDMLCGALG